MKKLLFTMTALAAFVAVAPASAQYSGRNTVDTRFSDRGVDAMTGADFRNRIAQLEARLQIGIRQGEISRLEERSIRPQLRYLRQLERNYSYNGLTWQERRDLQQRLRNTRQDIRIADNGRFDRDSRYANWLDNDYYGQGGPLEFDACGGRGGFGGLIESVIGRSCLRVGDQAPVNLYAVPGQYRSQYRDSSDSFFRSDGRLIYEIDADTNRVVSSWEINR